MAKPPRDGKDDDYKVGYRKPPKDTRFQPGQSGNPKGRPKGTKNLKIDLVEELGERILVREGDQARPVSKQRAMMKALVVRALKGDTRAASLLISMSERHIEAEESGPLLTATSAESLASRLSELIKHEQKTLPDLGSSDGEDSGEE